MLKIPFQLGDRLIHAAIHENKSGALTMLNVHEDETTSVRAGKTSIEQRGGRVIELVHSGGRLITFGLGGQTYTFDPNRIFSDNGIVETLKKHSAYFEPAHKEIKKFADAFLQEFRLDQEPVIIALHNTLDGIFSVETFLPSGHLGGDAAAVHVSPRRNKFDFFFVTEKTFFDFLGARDFNVVLQDNANATDDGSLSVYFARRGIPYVNIEAEMGRLEPQIEMIAVAREMIGK